MGILLSFSPYQIDLTKSANLLGNSAGSTDSVGRYSSRGNFAQEAFQILANVFLFAQLVIDQI